MATYLMTGGTGLIGKQLGLALTREGHKLIGITRNQQHAQLVAPYPATWVEGSLETSVPDLSKFAIDGVFHLAGESLADKNWSPQQKEKILQSRVAGTKNLGLALQTQKNLKFIVGASAIGYYSTASGDSVCTETSASDDSFLSQVVQAWERSYKENFSSIRQLIFRFGVVLSTEGGALPKMLLPAQMIASSRLGSGKQWMSWVHLQDVIRALQWGAQQTDLQGIYNLVAPHPVQQKVMATQIADSIHGLKGPPAPRLALQLLLGEQSQLVLTSTRASSEKLQKTGFQFQYPELSLALDHLLKDWQNGQTARVFQQYLPFQLEHVFQFFCDPQNLEKITPQLLQFKVLNISTPTLQKGTLIDYKLKVHGVPVKWTSEIEKWEHNVVFVDQQIRGPYQKWHHTHSFEKLAEGTLMTDRVIYKLPMGALGRLFGQSFVNSDVSKIFDYRRQVVQQYM